MNFPASRRAFLRTVCVGGAVGLAGCSGSSPSASGSGDDDETATESTPSTGADGRTDSFPDRITLDPLVTGLDAPLDVAFTPDGRHYIAEQAGRILVHGDDGLASRPLLDIEERIEAGGEKGLLGIALHPDFASNGRLFVRYSAPSRPGTPSGFSHTFVLSEFVVSDEAATDERTLLEIPQPQGNHNAGDIAFGPEGFLYVAVGDGGAGGDQGRGHVDDWYDGVGGGNGQDVTENLLGSILRLDVDTEDEPYRVPDDNPLVGREGLAEQYAWGFRNPWRMSFDDDDLFVGDVGQNAFEEVSLVTKGGNYGWNVREGTHCFGADDCPTTGPDGQELIDPIIEYPHDGADVSGISVIGGAVYRGSAVPALEGVYVFGDFRTQGRLFAATRVEEGLWPTSTLDLEKGDRLQQLRSVGRAPDGELYVVGTGSEGGGVFRLDAA